VTLRVACAGLFYAVGIGWIAMVEANRPLALLAGALFGIAVLSLSSELMKRPRRADLRVPPASDDWPPAERLEQEATRVLIPHQERPPSVRPGVDQPPLVGLLK
jgi:hypothetical protein